LFERFGQATPISALPTKARLDLEIEQ